MNLLYGEPNEFITQIPVAGKDIQLHRDVIAPLIQLEEALSAANLPIVIISTWRSFDYQCSLWNNKWLGHRPLLDRDSQPLTSAQLSDHEKFNALCHWSAIPGTSRHHWGTDFDIFLKAPIKNGYSVQLTPEEFAPQGVCAELEHWLNDHLEEFGFYRPYQNDRGGVAPEPWHISYFALADNCLQKLRATEAARKIMQSNLQGKQLIVEQLEHYFLNYVRNIELSPTARL